MRKGPFRILIILLVIQRSAMKLSKVVQTVQLSQDLISDMLFLIGPPGPKRHCFINKRTCVRATVLCTEGNEENIFL